MLNGIQSILIGLTEEGQPGESLAALSYGISLADAAKAHVTVQAASVKLGLNQIFVNRYAEGLVRAENIRLDSIAKSVEASARQSALASGLACTTYAPQLSYPALIASFSRLARVHDLTLLDAEPVVTALDRGLIEAILTGSGRPLIVVPPGHEAYKAGRVIIAWDGKAKAARALNDALPFIRAAEKVEVVSVDIDKSVTDLAAGVEIAPHLARHGVDVTVLNLPAVDGDVAKALRNHASLTHADMLVMGAFMHSRLRETVLGGVTQSMLQSCPVPLFLSF